MAAERFKQFQDMLAEAPVIAAVKDGEGLARALDSECRVIFLLYGTLLSVQEQVRRIHDEGKLAIIHSDLIEGLSGREIAVDYLSVAAHADGVISTRPGIIRHARELGLICIQRFFLLDSMSFENVLRLGSHADAIDVLPGVIPKVISRLTGRMQQPLIASGLLFDKQDVIAALSAGALAVSTTDAELWTL